MTSRPGMGRNFRSTHRAGDAGRFRKRNWASWEKWPVSTSWSLGCGAAQWSIALARRGARPVGLDFSRRQLTHAADLIARSGVRVLLVLASAEAVPFRHASFDVVFADYGATTFTDPHRTIPEAARVLRPGGLLAFSGATPGADVCWPEEFASPTERLHRDYFGLHRLEYQDSTDFQLPYGDWIRLFGSCGLTVEDLIELRPAPDAPSTYRDNDAQSWARRWPAEHIWKTRKTSVAGQVRGEVAYGPPRSRRP